MDDTKVADFKRKIRMKGQGVAGSDPMVSAKNRQELTGSGKFGKRGEDLYRSGKLNELRACF